jgi:hypothetical protein
MLFSWTQQLREQVCKIMNKKAPTLSELTTYYNPKMLSKDVWGPILWKLLHTTMLRCKMENLFCPPYIQKALKAFITCFAILIPCKACRAHAWEYYSTHEIDSFLNTNLHAFEWTVLFHNAVTIRTNTEHGYNRKTFNPVDALALYAVVPEGVSFSKKFMTTL